MTPEHLNELKELKDKIAICSLGLNSEIFDAALRIGTILQEVEISTNTANINSTLPFTSFQL